MSYTPTNWQTGDTITAPLLNKMEQGIASAGGGGVLMVNITGGVLDKTWQEIVDAPFAIITEDLVDGTAKLLEAGYDVYQGEYSVYFVSLFENQLTTRIFSAASADAYPRETI